MGCPNPKLDVVVDAQLVQKKVLRFWFVKIRPKDAVDAKSIIEDAVRLYEETDQRLLQISESIKEKVIDREEVVSRLKNLKSYDLYRLNGSIDGKKDFLTHLHGTAQYIVSKSCLSQEKLEKHKLNLRTQHKTKNLAQEKQLFRDINVNQQRKNDSTLPLEELSKILWQIQWKYQYYHRHNNQKNCDNKLVEEVKQFEVTRKISKDLRETVRSQVKVICDELMEMRKKKRALEAKIKGAEKELEAINEEIWSLQKNLKEKHHRKGGFSFLS